jgi:hypothetical protein
MKKKETKRKIKRDIRRDILNVTFKIFKWFLFGIAVVLTLLSIIVIITVSANHTVCINEKNIIYFLNLFQPYKTLLAATFIVIPAYVGLVSFISKLHYQEGEALLNLRKLLSEPENLEIHKKLRGDSGDWAHGIPEAEKDKDTWRKIDNYLGILEFMNILIDKGVLSPKNFNNQFGYRAENVYANKDITEYIKLYECKDWENLMHLFRKMKLNTTKYLKQS